MQFFGPATIRHKRMAKLKQKTKTTGVNTERKVHIDCEKGAQISILANKIATQ